MNEKGKDAVVAATVAVALQRPPDEKTTKLETIMRHLLGAMRAVEELRELGRK